MPLVTLQSVDIRSEATSHAHSFSQGPQSHGGYSSLRRKPAIQDLRSASEAFQRKWSRIPAIRITPPSPNPFSTIDTICIAFTSSASFQSRIRALPSQVQRQPFVSSTSHTSPATDPPRPHLNLAITDITFLGNAIFLHTPSFPHLTRDLHVNSCRYLNLSPSLPPSPPPSKAQGKNHAHDSLPTLTIVAGHRKQQQQQQQHSPSARLRISKPADPDARPDFYFEVCIPAVRVGSAGRKCWDVVARVSLTAAIRGLVGRRIEEEDGSEWMRRLAVESESLIDFWSLCAEHDGKGRRDAVALEERDDGCGYGVESESECGSVSGSDVDGCEMDVAAELAEEAEVIFDLAADAFAELRDFVIFVPVREKGGWEVGFLSAEMHRRNEAPCVVEGELDKLSREGAGCVNIEVGFEDGRVGVLRTIRVGNGRQDGTMWWIGFVEGI